MKVYVVEMNWPYEGSEIQSIFSSHSLAYQYVQDRFSDDIEKDETDYFDLGYDYITITDYTIDKEINNRRTQTRGE